jgi:hypothetical protein
MVLKVPVVESCVLHRHSEQHIGDKLNQLLTRFEALGNPKVGVSPSFLEGLMDAEYKVLKLVILYNVFLTLVIVLN